MLNTSSGFQNLLKEGYKHYAGLEEAILRNIAACKEISLLTRTSYGPNGMKKMVVNHIDRLFITNDTATILREVEVNHPAAKIIAMASKMQKEDYGDCTNYVITLAGELLSQAETLIKSGLHPSAIISGYQIALEEIIKNIESSVSFRLENVQDEKKVELVLEAALAPKLPNNYKFFAQLLTHACMSILQDNAPRFNSENIRFVKILGGNVDYASVVRGFVIARAPENSDKSLIEKPKIAVYNCPFDPQGGETKGTVLITKAEDLLKYNSTEEELAEKIVKSIVETGVNVVVVGGSIAELCLHYLSKYGIFVLKVQSKWELQRLCKSINAIAVPKLTAPLPEEIGYCDSITVKEIGSTKVTVFEKNQVSNRIATVVLRGATNSIMEDIERALENGISVFKQALTDNRYINGASAIECFLLNKLETHSGTLTGLEQYSVAGFGQAFEIIPRILLENSGLNANESLPNIISLNGESPSHGINVFKGKIELSSELQVYENLACKLNAIKLAAHAALTILRIDQIIVAKPSGGPKPKENKGWDND
jgi:T-complex protein 1 subunit theta